jgi:hypothetical protein
MKKCYKCYNEVPDNLNFCPDCGNRFNIKMENYRITEDVYEKKSKIYGPTEKQDYLKVNYRKNNNYGYKLANNRISYRLLNSLAFVIPPLGFISFFLYLKINRKQSYIYLVWSIIGTLFIFGIIS